MSEKILFVDDDPNLLAACERNLRKTFAVETAVSGEAALQKLAVSGPYAVVVADRQMPGMDGIRLLTLVKERAPETVRLMLTGNADLEAAIRVVNEGNIFRFLMKPCPSDELSKALNDALAQYRLVMAEKELLSKTLNGSIRLLTDILSMIDPQSFGRAQLLRDAIAKLAGHWQIPNAWEIHLAVMLAPIGLVTIPPHVLVKARKGDPLLQAEEQMLARVPESTGRLLANIPRLEGVARIIQYQHARFDGGGSAPGAPREGAIPVGSRVLKILSEMVELESSGMSRADALKELCSRQGWYDPSILSAICEFYQSNASPAAPVQPHTQSTTPSAPATHSIVPKTAIPVPAHSSAQPGTAVASAAPSGGPAKHSTKFLKLQAGMLLRGNVEANDGTIVLQAGQRLNDVALERIRNYARTTGLKGPLPVELVEQPAPVAPASDPAELKPILTTGPEKPCKPSTSKRARTARRKSATRT